MSTGHWLQYCQASGHAWMESHRRGQPHLISSTDSLFTMAGVASMEECRPKLPNIPNFQEKPNIHFYWKYTHSKILATNSKNCKNSTRVITVEYRQHKIGASCSLGAVSLKLWDQLISKGFFFSNCPMIFIRRP